MFTPDETDSSSSVFDSRKLVTRTQSLLVPKTRTKDDASAKKRQVSLCSCLFPLR
jgi:hypothetical protein